MRTEHSIRFAVIPLLWTCVHAVLPMANGK